jgi:protocatechuate 3,4-dioxygenase beta subunit
MPLNSKSKRVRSVSHRSLFDRSNLQLWQLEDRHVPAGTITGTIFVDFNANGVFDNTNPTIPNLGTGGTQTVGVAQDVPYGAGIQVTAYDPNNNQVGSATSQANGTFTLPVSGTGRYRLQFSGLPANVGTFYGPAGTSNGTTIRFVDDPNGGTTAGINLGIVSNSNYAQSNPLLITNRYVFGSPDGVNANVPTIQSFPYSAGRNIVDGTIGDGGASIPDYQNPTTHAINIPYSQIGTTWGLAEDENTARLFMAAFMKRHTDFGPSGTGAIYTANIPPQSQQLSNNIVTTASTFINLNTTTDQAGNFGLPGGTSFRSGAGYDYLTDGLSGNVGWDSVGKLGLGGLEVSPDGRWLYSVGLNTRRLYVVDTQTLQMRSYALPVFNDAATGITGISVNNPLGDLRPFAVSWYNGSIYVGAVNSAESTYTSNDPANRGDSSRLRAYVFRFNPGANPVASSSGQFVDLTGTATTAPVLNVPLNYARGYTHPGVSPNTNDDLQSEWLPWSPVYRNLNVPRDGAREAVYPQPMLTGLSFDAAGNIVLGLRDRAGDQFGAFTPADPNNPTNPMVGITAGDMLRAFGNPTTGWALESNGSDPRTGSPGGSSATGVGNSQGPGGGEFYNGDYLVPGIFNGIQDHNEIAAGGVLQIPGFPDALSTVFDPAMVSQRYNAGGVRWFSNSGASAGAAVKGYELYQTEIQLPNPPALFAKANGIGDLVAFSNPVVEIGNRIWNDANRNGVQDANEAGIANLQVLLLNAAGAPIGTTTTDSDGNYYFTNAMAATPAFPGKAYLSSEDASPTNLTGFVSGRQYTVRIPLNTAPNQGLLTGLTLTTLNAVIAGVNDPDSIDSDAVANGNNADIAVAALAINESNHTYDAGFAPPPPSLSIGDFIWNDANNDGQWQTTEQGLAGITVQLVNITAGTTVSQVTNAQGGYLFQNLQPGTYQVQIPFNNGTTQPNLLGYYSSTGSFSTNTGTFEPVTGDPLNNFDHGSTNTGLTFVTGPQLTLAFGAAPLNETQTANGGDRGISETIPDSNSYRNQDFGFWQPVSVGDRVWVDANNDGVRQTTEAPIQGVTVQLLNNAGTVVGTTQTNANGGYLFTYLAPGQYQVRIVRDAVLTGYISSTGSIGSSTGPFEPVIGDPSNDQDHGTQSAGFFTGPLITATIGGATPVAPATIPAGLPFDPAGATSQYRNQDFGVFQPLSVGDFVWNDANNNGTWDTTEQGIAGVQVQLVNTTTGTTLTQVTNAQGGYLFENLTAGTYQVQIPFNNSTTQPGLQGFYSSTGAFTTNTGPFEPVTGDPANNLDHGSTNTGLTFVSGPVITLAVGAAPLNETLTINGGDRGISETIPDANSYRNQDFGFWQPLSVGDRVWVDANNNGVRETTEAALQGVTVQLLDNAGTVVATTVTNAEGGYLFTYLSAGQYSVRLVRDAVLTGYVSSTGTIGSTSGPFEPVTADTANDRDHGTDVTGFINGPQVNLTIGGATAVDPATIPAGLPFDPAGATSRYRNQDFGVFQPLALGDFVWIDANNDGVLNTGETPLANVPVELLDAAGTALLDANGKAITTVTDTNGNYLFTNLVPGSYRVRITPPTGFVTSTGSNGSLTGPYEPGKSANENNEDHGSRDTLVSGRIIASVVTLATPGNASNPDPLNGIAGRANLRQDFGLFQRVSIGDFVWEDKNNDGKFQATESAISGVTVRLLDGSGNQVLGGANGTTPLTAITGTNGGYIFNELIPGKYQVEVVIPNGYRSSTGTNGALTGPFEPVTGDPSNNVDHGTTQTNGLTVRGPVVNALVGLAPLDDTDGPALTDTSTNDSSYRNQDFGFFRPVFIGDFVWEDVNNNGVFNTGESPIAKVAVELLDGSGTPVLDANGKAITTSTDAAGNYLFNNLIPGDYRVRITPPAGYISSTGKNSFSSGPFEPGVNDFTNNSDHGTTDGSKISTAKVTLGIPGDATLNPDSLVSDQPNRGNARQDFGLFRPLAIGDLVFRDVANDGVFDPGTDSPIPGVTVRLLDASNTVISTLTTDANGLYRFNLLSPGQYRVEIVPPAGLNSSTGNGFPASFPGPFEAAPQNTTNSVDKGTFNPTTGTIFTPFLVLGLPGDPANPDENGLANLRQDFGLISPQTPPPPALAAISGHVYVDNNINGIREPGEQPIGGTRVYLNGTSTTGTAVTLTTFTDSNGFYQFTNLPAGTYTIREEQPNGFFYDGLDTPGTVGGTTRGTGGNDILQAITLNPGDSGINYDFGEIQPVDTFGHVWVDTNRNAIREAGEAPIPGVAVTISGTAFAGTSLARPLTAADVPNGLVQTTNAAGRYDFTVLPPGQYNLTETQPVDFDDWMEQNGDPFGAAPTITNDQFSGITLNATAPIRGPFNFGEVLSEAVSPPVTSPQVPNDPTKREFLGSTTETANRAAARRSSATTATEQTQPSPGINSTVTPLNLQPRFSVNTGSPTRPAFVAVGSGTGITPQVRVFDYSTGIEKFRIQPYESTYTGGVRTAVADINNDGIVDVVTATGIGGGPRIRVFSGLDGSALQDFFAYEDSYRGGVSLAVGDVDGDGTADIIAGTDQGGGPRVRVFSGSTGLVLQDFFAFDQAQRGGVRVAAADFNADGRADIVTTTGAGVPTIVRVFDGLSQSVISEYQPYGSFSGGAFVSAGDFNGDGTPDVITGADAGGGPHVQVFSGLSATSIASFFAMDSAFTGGVRVAAADVNGDGRVEVVTGAGSGGGARVSIYSGAGINVVDDFFAYDIDHVGGVYVGAGPSTGLKATPASSTPSETGALGKPGSLPSL